MEQWGQAKDAKRKQPVSKMNLRRVCCHGSQEKKVFQNKGEWQSGSNAAKRSTGKRVEFGNMEIFGDFEGFSFTFHLFSLVCLS